METTWFKGQLADKKLSQRAFAKLLDLDHAAISLMFRGKRRMTPTEAKKIADVLGVKVTEVLRRAGVAVQDDVQRVPITCYINGNGVVTLFPEKTHDSVVGPADCPKGTYAVQCRCPSQPQDGWLVFVSPAQNMAEQQMDRLCLVAMNEGTSTIAVVRRGYRNGTYNLITWPARDLRTDSLVAWCAPVLWIKP